MAGAISVIMFVALHVPIRLDAGIVGADLASNLLRVAVWGVLFTVLFVWTRNVWLVIGIHAITNRPGLWIDAGGSARIAQIAVAVLFITTAVVWSLTRKAKKKPDSSLAE